MANEVGLGVARKISLMPVHVSLVVLALTCVFAVLASLRSGRVRCVPEGVIRRQVADWTRSRLSLVSDTMLLYGRLTRFQYYSRSEAHGIDRAGA